MHEWDDARLNELLQQAATYNKVECARLVAQFAKHLRDSADTYPVDKSKRLLEALKNKRFFDLLVRAAEALIEPGQDAPVIRRLLAQGLIEQGHLILARDLLLRLEENTRPDEFENAEARGLLGRVHKQLYIRDGDASVALRRRHIQSAVEWYASAYMKDRDKNYWHGINVVACVMRARRDGVPVASSVDPEEVARNTLSTIATRKEAAAWELATAMEAYVALNDADRALSYALKYVESRDADAFEIGSTLRQLREVWQLRPDHDPGRSLLPLLEGTLLKREGGTLRRSSEELQALGSALATMNLEVRFGKVQFLTLRWLAQGIARANLVASISDRFDRRVGSGFLVRSEAIWPGTGNKPILVTNSHVIGGPHPRNGHVHPRDAIVRFENVGRDAYFCREQLLFTSPYSELDVSLSELTADRQLERLTAFKGGMPLAWRSPPPKDGSRKVFVVGHPEGADLALSFEDSLLLDYDDKKIHYRSATAEGSSGSPVFDDTWELVALHHGGSAHMSRLDRSGIYEANEGILMDAIAKAAQ